MKVRSNRLPWLLALAAWAGTACAEGDRGHFERVVLSENFDSEGATVADIDGDQKLDVISGPYWYRGPTFEQRTAYAPVKEYSIRHYSDHFFCFASDFDEDGDVDILSVPMPGRDALWYENPGETDRPGPWKHHTAFEAVDNESPVLADLTGDGRRELVCLHQGRYGYARPDRAAPGKPWKFVPVSPDLGHGRFTHGLGVGDVNGDGRPDLLERDGWWEQPERAGEMFLFHPERFAASGGSQMFAYDFDGDGDQDVVSVQNAHAYGLFWFEQRQEGDSIRFTPHTILADAAPQTPDEPSISQMHALALADIDGDGIQDIVTGKRYWAHGGRDPGARQPPVLVWFRTVRTPEGVKFHQQTIHPRVGVGTQVTVADLESDGDPDVVVGNKLGTFVMLNHHRQ